jgi:cargo-transport protein YPP1
MDIYEEKIPVEEPLPTLGQDKNNPIPPRPSLIPSPPETTKAQDPPKSQTLKSDPTPTELNRLAARDRASMLLTTLTRLGSGWDNSEAWYTLARAHELSKQIGKAKQALWWVVELEDNKPVRPWRDVGGGFTL